MDEGTFHVFGMGESSSLKLGEVFLIKRDRGGEGGGGLTDLELFGGGGWVKRDEVNFFGWG